MIFHSLDFAVFLLVFLSIYWLLPHRAQNLFLLVGSYFFYGYIHPWFLILLFASTVGDYTFALGMRRFEQKKKLLLVCSLCMNLGLLSFFKYFGFFVDNVLQVASLFHVALHRPTLNVVLPVGISFYTFQSLSYTIDVYRGRLEPRRSFLDVATFLALFPQLVAGPIERATHVLPQVERKRSFDPEQARTALLMMTWGYFKKLVIADNVALIANKVFALSSPGFALVWVGTLAFCVQIYADFSAYSAIARGTARLLGFELMKNFDHPYLSQTPVEFWHRWHISLSTWFRDYVYIPLGGNRGSKPRVYFNLFVTFVLSGFWHGASWNFLMWGAYHGLLLVVFRALEGVLPSVFRVRWLAPIRVLVMFALVNLGWLMFRETDIHQLLADLSLRPGSDSSAQLMAAGHFLGMIAFYSLPLAFDSVLYLCKAYDRARATLHWAVLEGAAGLLLVAGITLFYSELSSDFIYFQF
ncbi:MAG TPA: MBOAT family O-acyltransferase [Polyangiaceae bacterium]|jgi:D-alanyl-lipoteichoic acid acyltransferase DltB (MBOAT superfamily)|nr:MBOAT family O-acyltransferase [Polyangiaceae bacterium]